MTGSDEEERESAEDQREDSLDLNAINFLSRSIRTRFGRVISLSHRALDTFMPVISVAGFRIFSARSPNTGTIRFRIRYLTLYYNNTIVIYSKWLRVTGWTRHLIKTGSSWKIAIYWLHPETNMWLLHYLLMTSHEPQPLFRAYEYGLLALLFCSNASR